MSSNIETKIKEMLKYIEPYLAVDKFSYLSARIHNRLNKSLQEYRERLDWSYKRLMQYCEKYEVKVIERLNKNDKCDR